MSYVRQVRHVYFKLFLQNVFFTELASRTIQSINRIVHVKCVFVSSQRVFLKMPK